MARRLAEDHDLVYLSGRPEALREATTAWLRRHGLPPGELVLRPAGDRRPASVTKLHLLRRLAGQRPVAAVVDDDAAVCAAYRKAGFTVLEAEWGRPAPAAEQAALFDAQQGVRART